jgi:hypothetical protein
VFDLQTKRPEFVEYAPTVKPHDNRFLNINLDTLNFSKNQRPKTFSFQNFISRGDNVFATTRTSGISGNTSH